MSQRDMSMPTSDKTITRGQVMYVVDGKFVKGTADEAGQGSASVSGPEAYFSLGNSSDPDARMAGAINGISCGMSLRIETDQFTGTPAVGDFMMIGAGGKLVAHTDGLTAVLRVTKAPYRRYSNMQPRAIYADDKSGDVIGYRDDITGDMVSVIEGDTVYLPKKTIN